MTGRCILTITILQLMIVICSAVNGVIWCKQKQEFVQLFSISQFAALQEENLAKRRTVEMRDMKHEIIKAAYYEERNLVMFINNDTKITGICGDLWYLLADYLNFTLSPVKSITRNFGEKLENGSSTGFFNMLETNEAQVILRTEYILTGIYDVDYSMSFWKSKYHIYIQPEWLYDNKWVFSLFPPIIWFSIIFLFVIASLIGYFLQKIPKNRKIKRKRNDSVNFSLNDHFFHSYAMMCSQGYIPDAFQNKFKILSFSKSIFAWLVMLAFSSNLIYRMTYRESTLSFTDLDSLFNNTKYTLLAFRGSFFYNYFQRTYVNDKNSQDILARVRFIETAEDMYNEICNNFEKYAMFEIEDRYMAINRHNCPLLSTGNYNETWITSALKKNSPYKKTIDAALIKFNEVGLLDFLKDRWLDIRFEPTKESKFKMIDLHQVYLIFLIPCYGVLISLAILVLENIIHCHETKYNFRIRK